MARIKRNDTVVVIAGAEKGKRGRVLHVDRARERVLVEGLNVHRKAQRRTPDNPQGGIDDVESPIHISNVMLEETYNARHADKGQPAASDGTADSAADNA